MTEPQPTVTHLTATQDDSDNATLESVWDRDRPEKLRQTVLTLTDYAALERVAQPAEASPHLLGRMEALIHVIQHLQALSLSEAGEGTPPTLTAENIGVYVSEEACEVLNAIQQQAIHTPTGTRHLLQQPNLVTALLPTLLWAIARSDYAYMQWLGGVAANVQEPGQPWRSGMLRLVAVLTAVETEPTWQLDLAIGDAPGPRLADGVQISEISGISSDQPLTIGPLLKQICQQLQTNSPELALLMAGSTAEWLTPGGDWRSGQIQLSLQFTFMADAHTETLTQAVEQLKALAPEADKPEWGEPESDELGPDTLPNTSPTTPNDAPNGVNDAVEDASKNAVQGEVQEDVDLIEIPGLEEVDQLNENQLGDSDSLAPTQDAVTLEMFQDDLSEVEEGVATVLPGTVPGTRVPPGGTIERTRLTKPTATVDRSDLATFDLTTPVGEEPPAPQPDEDSLEGFGSEIPIALAAEVETQEPNEDAAEDLTLADFGSNLLPTSESNSEDPAGSEVQDLFPKPTETVDETIGETLDSAFEIEEPANPVGETLDSAFEIEEPANPVGETLDSAFEIEESKSPDSQARSISFATPPTLTIDAPSEARPLSSEIATAEAAAPPIPASNLPGSQVPEMWLDLGRLQPTPAVNDQLRRQKLTLILSQFQRDYRETGWPDLPLEEDETAVGSLVTTAWELSNQEPPTLTTHFPNAEPAYLPLQTVLPWLLWQVAKTSCPIMQLVGGITTDLLQPGVRWQNGLLRLVPVLHLQTEDLDLSLDVATGEPWREERTNLNGAAVVQAETFHPLQGPTRIDEYRFVLIQQVQQASPIANLLTHGAEIAVSTRSDQWQTGTLSLSLHFTLENW